MVNELWKDIPGYEGYYQASDAGRVRSVDRFINNGMLRGRVLRQYTNKDGYKLVRLSKTGVCVTYQVHRLIYLTFHGPIPEGMQVNHIDENPANNELENLNLMSPKENNNYGTRNRRTSEKLTNGVTSKAVYQYSEEGWFIRKWVSVNEIQRKLGYEVGNISACCLGKRKQAYGFIWTY